MDKRVARTQKLLLQSLISYKQLGNKFEEITVRDLCEQAGIARQTYYRNYLLKEDIIIKQISLAMDNFTSELKKQTFNSSSFIKLLIRFWKQNQEIFELIDWAGLSYQFILNLANFNKLVLEQNENPSENTEYIANYYAGATYMFMKTFMDKNDFSEKAYERGAEVYSQLTNQCKGLFEPLK